MTPDAVSAGGVVYQRTQKGLELLLIRDRFGRWTLPKGHLEEGEGYGEAALREIREETGIEGRLVGPLPDSTYYFNDHGKRVRKTVRYYLVAAMGGEPVPQEEEVAEVRWFPAEDVSDLHQYDNNRPVIEAAVKRLTG